MIIVFTKKFLVDTAERVIMTMAEAAAGAFGVNQVSALDMDWRHIGAIAASAGILALLKALYARNRGNPENASLVQ